MDLHITLVGSDRLSSLGMLYVLSGCGSNSVSMSHRSCAVLEAVQNSSSD